jgi:diguanylate cyclase (GGDEF)-like protein
MTSLEALLAAMLLQQAFICLMWFGGAWLRLARQPALHWGLATLLLGLGMGLLAVRDQVDPWLGRWGANALNLLGFVIAARGAAIFTRTPTRDRENALVLFLGMGGAALALATPLDDAWITVFASSAMAWAVLRAAWLSARALHLEFGAWGARLSAAPLALIGLLMALRAAGAAAGSGIGQPLDVSGQSQIGLMLGFIGLTLLVNGGFCGMVLLRLIGRLRHLSMHDALTGLPNRRSLLAALDDEHLRLGRGGRGYALLSIDVDHFKRVNDHHGHAGGDAALAHIAETMRSVARASDRPARVGGEEFAMLLPATDRGGALRAAERLLQAVRERPLRYGEVNVPLTISIGVSVVESATEELAMLWKRVDAALYAAKAQGRNRLVLSEA